MNQPKLGQLIDQNQQRDAIHIAIAPVEAAHDLRPGEHVGLLEGKATNCATYIGIVDPFLTAPVRTGQWFYLCLYQQTVTNLRHDWTHPDFEASQPMIQPPPTGDKADSENWLRSYVARNCPYDTNPEHAFTSFMDRVNNEREVFYHGSDLHGLYELEEADAFFFHLSIYLGRIVSPSDFTYSCSC